MAATVKGYDFARQNGREAAPILIASAPKGTFPDPQLVYDSQCVSQPALCRIQGAPGAGRTLQPGMAILALC